MSSDKDLQEARASDEVDDKRRGLRSSTGRSLAAHTKDLLRRYGLRPRKSLGQNFLIKAGKVRQIAAAVADAVCLTASKLVLEVGPGLGTLTSALADFNLTVVAFEIDPYLAGPLQETVAMLPQVTVRFEDFLHADTEAVAGGEPYVVAGNLPYQITAPLLEKLFLAAGCRAAVVTVQREVADRLRAAPGSKAYGPLTLFCEYYVQRLEVVCRLQPPDFLPSPAVDSTALCLVKRAVPPFRSPAAEAFFRTVRAAFAHRRKSLRSGLALTPGLGKEASAALLAAAGLDGQRRAETLTSAEFARLALAWENLGNQAGEHD